MSGDQERAENQDIKRNNTHDKASARDKDKLIDELRNQVTFLEKELLSRKEDQLIQTEVPGTQREKRTEGEFQEMGRQLAEGQMLTGTGSWEMDLATGEVVFSDNMLRILGLPPGRHTYDEYRNKVHPEDRARRDAEVEEAISGNKQYVTEYRIVLPDNSVRHIHAVGRATRDSRGEPVKFTSTIQDVTERKRTEDALKENLAMLAKSQEIGHLGSWSLDFDTEKFEISDELYRIHGFEPGTVEPTLDLVWTLIHRDDLARYREYIEALRQEGRLGGTDYRVVWLDGSVHYLHAQIDSVVRGPDGRVKTASGITQDITERKRTEEELRMAREELELRVRERTSELEKVNVELEDQVRVRQRSEMALRSSEEELQMANRALKALAKCKEAMIRAVDEASLLDDICRIVVDVGGYRMAWIGYVENDELRTVRPIARAGYDEGYVDNLKIALNDPVRGNGPTGISLNSGRPYRSRNVETDSSMLPWRTEALKRGYHSTMNLPLIYEGQIMGTLVIYSGKPYAFDGEEPGLLTDLADNLAFGIRAIRNRARRDRAEGELLRAKEGLEARVNERTEELNSAKEQAELYLDLMGHDINNMHQIALGYLELARDMHPEASQSEFLDKPIEVLQRSARLIRNVRKLQRLKDGVFQTQVVDVCHLLVDVQREFGAVPHKAVTLNLNGCEQCHVHANELLHDVFANLVGNAIKHTGDRADIVVDLDVVWNDGRQYCRVMVEDNGPGIPDDFKGKIFKRLLKGTDKAKGMGLGLYLVKSLVESYNGRVWAEDRVSGDHTKGARFLVMLPAIEN